MGGYRSCLVVGVMRNGSSHCRQTVTESPCPIGMSSGRAAREEPNRVRPASDEFPQSPDGLAPSESDALLPIHQDAVHPVSIL